MKIELKENERLDDLQRNGLKIIQKTDGFCFGMDAVLLSGFAQVKPGETVLDLEQDGHYSASAFRQNRGKRFVGLEIQEAVAEMGGRSVAFNELENKIQIMRGDIKEASRIFGSASFDVVTANPPYMNDAHGLKNPAEIKAISRHEVLCTLEDVIREGTKVLKPGGRMYMVHRPHRLMEILGTMKSFKLEPKRMKFVHPFQDRDANMVLIEAVRGGGSWMKVEPPVIVYESPGVYTEEIYRVYGY